MPTGHIVRSYVRPSATGRNYVVYNPTTKKYFAGNTLIGGAPGFSITESEDEAVGFPRVHAITEMLRRGRYPGFVARPVRTG